MNEDGLTLLQERAENLINLLRVGNFRTTACQRLGLHYNQFMEWMRRGEAWTPGDDPKYKAFYEAVLAAEAEAEGEIVEVFHKAARRDWKAADAFLSKRYKDRWSPRTESTGANGGAIQIADMTADERRKRIEELEARREASLKKPMPATIIVENLADGTNSEGSLALTPNPPVEHAS